MAAGPIAISLKIILNADDFGLSSDTVETTIRCFESGLLTSATIMAGAPATEEALEYARARPEFSFGVHLQFVGDGAERPLSDPSLLPRLVDERGRFLPTNVVRRRALLRMRYLRGDRDRDDRPSRVRAIARGRRDARRLPQAPSQVSADQSRAGACAPSARPDPRPERPRRLPTRPVRNPTALLGPSWRRALMRRFATTEHFYMPTTTSDICWEEVASRMPAGESIEIGLHPGAAEEWRRGTRRWD